MTDPSLQQEKLYIALYTRDFYETEEAEDDGRYHWALLAVPPQPLPILNEPTIIKKATRFHARDYHSGPSETHWLYEEIRVNPTGTQKLLAQIPIGDILDNERFLELIRDLPIEQGVEGWNCVTWIKSALSAIDEDGEVVSGGMDEHAWMMLRVMALRAADTEVERKTALASLAGKEEMVAKF
ncbi:hypothetical protein BT63DRAFT_420173 [Microthyrium microscopicum]|uniref:Uncharacterized protein n=1 Tax=Microthyrium microscopicum TaxID=703497 RepID=A0A6A6URP5_9PEZI|nr:hypothetical protein BT63DRAFT_420173 [Microthyrium microscopicum]